MTPKTQGKEISRSGTSVRWKFSKPLRSSPEKNGWQSLIPPENTKKEYINFAYRAVRRFREETGHKGYHFHGERHAFAQEYFRHFARRQGKADQRLESTMEQLSREKLREIKREVSEALGHSRVEITRAYGV